VRLQADPSASPSPAEAGHYADAEAGQRDLERQLIAATAALKEAEQRHAAAMTAAANQLAEQQLKNEVATAGAAARWELVDEQLRTATMEAATAQQNYLAAAAGVERLTRRESELSTQLAEAAAKQESLERGLADAGAALEAARARAEQERTAAAAQFTERQSELQALVSSEQNKRAAVESSLVQAVRARDEAEMRHLSATAEATARQRELEAALAASRQDHESSLAEIELLSAREAQLDAALAEVRASHGNLERRIAATEAAFRDADARATRERLAATRKAAAREAELDGQIRDEREARADLERALAEANAVRGRTESDNERLAARVREVEGVLAQAQLDRQSAVEEIAGLKEREADLSSRLAGTAAELADVNAACDAVEGELAQVVKQAIDLEQSFGVAEAAWSGSQQQYEAALAEAAQLLAEHRTTSDRELARTAADRDRVSGQLRDLEDVLAQARADHESAANALVARLAKSDEARQVVARQLGAAIAAASAREAELARQVEAEREARTDLERAFSDAEAGWRGSEQQYESALAAAAKLLAEHRTNSERELSQSQADCDRLSERLREVESVLARARADHQAAATELGARLTDSESARQTVERQLADAMMDAAARETRLDRQLQAEREARAELERTLSESRREADEAVRVHEEAKARSDREQTEAVARQADLEARLTQESERRQALERTVAETREAAADAARAFERQIAVLRSETRERQDRFEALEGERLGLQQSLAGLQERTRQLDADTKRLSGELAESGRLLGAARSELEQVRARLAATTGELDGTTARLNAAQAQADTVPRLRRELEDSRAENGRLFQQAGLAMFRCTRAGEVTQANRAAMTLVGRRTIDELRGDQFSTVVFEDPNGLSWLIDRCLATRTRESIETTWRRKDGGRLFVRLSAYACAPDVVEILAEDLTRVRVLQERLGQAQRIESVGRLAAEVAASCGSLLNDVHQQAQDWLMAAGTSAAARQQGEQLLADVTRAAGLLRQLSAYGEEQARTPAPADLGTVIHDLEPVLKRLAGDAVDVQLPGKSSRLNVDVGPERIERLLVNLAAYGRARMPFGGQLKIELGTTVVDRRFAAKHPNVRLGPHALITVTETKSSRRGDSDAPPGSSEQKPGVDFGTLHGLVGGCGGHLWMTVQPQGDMVAKIRLPLLAFHDEVAPRKLIARGGRALTRLFHL
jgi:chromosome segregation ATPase